VLRLYNLEHILEIKIVLLKFKSQN